MASCIKGAILHAAQIFRLVMSAAACGGDDGVLSAADGAAGDDGSRRSARAGWIPRHSDRTTLPRDPDQHRSAGDRDHGRDAHHRHRGGNVPATASVSRPRRFDRDVDLSAGVPRRGRRIPDYPACRTPGPDRRYHQPSVRREAGLCLFHLRAFPRVPLFFDPARHSDDHGGGAETRRRPEEAARSLGAGPWAVQRDVVLPALGPAFVASGAIAFATAMGAFGTAFALATNIDVLPMLIYTEFTLAANFATSAALSVGLGMITWAILALARSLSGSTVAAAG